MDKEAEELLKASIEIWEVKRDTKYDMPIDISEENCPLCKRYNDDEDNCFTPVCDKCPVKLRTKKAHCTQTPYSTAVKMLDFYRNDPTELTKGDWVKASQDEIDFLKSLLSEGE